MDTWDGDDPGDSDSWLRSQQAYTEYGQLYKNSPYFDLSKIKVTCYICNNQKVKTSQWFNFEKQVHVCTFECCRTETKEFDTKTADAIMQGGMWLAFL